MIVLDTHIWVWWVHDAPELPDEYRTIIEAHETGGFGISAIPAGKSPSWLRKVVLACPCQSRTGSITR